MTGMFGGYPFRATTILAVQRDGATALAGDGQVTVGEIILKHRARKIRRLYQDTVLAGFAGAVADAITLFDKFDAQLERYSGNLRRASVELTKEWRTDRFLRRLEAQLVVADSSSILVLSGDGEVIEPDDQLVAIGSGGAYALAAARALRYHTSMPADQIAHAAMEIAASLCIYTNHEIVVDTLAAPISVAESDGPVAGGEACSP